MSDTNEIDGDQIRKLISDNITLDEYNSIIHIYKILSDTDDFYEEWDPYDMDYDTFKEIILSNNFWGDIHLLSLLTKYSQINCKVLFSNEYTDSYYYYPLLDEYDPSHNTIILLYENEVHFKLIGHFTDNDMITLFTNETLPDEIINIRK